MKDFTKLDVAVVAAIVALLALLVAANATGERGRAAQCRQNLARLGQGMQAYAADHNGGLPPAHVAPGDVAWCFLVAPYVQPALKQVDPVIARFEYEEGISRRLLCPADPVVRGYPRSYAMSAHSMKQENWPVDPDTTCGVGLVWTPEALQRLLGRPVPPGQPVDPASLPAIRPAELPDPAGTLLLTDFPHLQNKYKGGGRAAVGEPEEQLSGLSPGAAAIHRGKFNYLMVDGHVETLRPYSMRSFSGSAGIWSVKKGD